MILKDIFEVQKNPELKAEYEKTYNALKERFPLTKIGLFDIKAIFDKFEEKPDYAHTTYVGKIKDDVELTELELSMICDNGYMHFGGKSTIRPDKTFEVVIYTD